MHKKRKASVRISEEINIKNSSQKTKEHHNNKTPRSLSNCTCMMFCVPLNSEGSSTGKRKLGSLRESACMT